MDHVVKAIRIVRRIHRQTLFTLRATELVTRRLIVIWKRNDGRQEPHNRTGVDLQVAVLGLDVLGKHGHIGLIRLIGVHQLYRSTVRQQSLQIVLQRRRLR